MNRGAVSKATEKPAPHRSSPENISIAHDFFLRAQSQEMAGNPAAALGYYQIAFVYNPESRDLCFLLLDHLSNAGKLDSAAALGKTCLALEGTATAQEYQAIGEVYLRKDDAASAVKYYREAAKLNEDDREILFVLAGLYEKLRDLPDYAVTLRRLLPQLEYPPRLVEKLVQAYSVLGQPDSALGLYRELLAKNPEDQKVLFAYSLLLQSRGDFEEAYTPLEKLVKANPASAIYQYGLGYAGLQLRKPESRLHFEKAVELEPTAAEYWARWVYSDLAFGDDSLAVLHLSRLPDSLNESWKNPFFKGLVHSLLAQDLEAGGTLKKPALLQDSTKAWKQRETAVGFFHKALDQNPGNELVLFELGTNLERTGRRDSAMQVLRQLVDSDTLNSIAMNYLGYMLVEDNKELDFAERLIDRALSVEPENGAYLDSKGWLCYRKGDFRSALSWLKKAAQHFPADPTIHQHLITVVKLLGEKPPDEK